MKNYPRTLEAVGLVVGIAVFLAIVVLWHPFAWIFTGAIALSLIVDSVRRDRNAKKRSRSV